MKGLYIQTYGCQMNSSDSDRMRALLAPLGYESLTSPENADLILINTCSIRDKAESKLTTFAFDVKGLKKKSSAVKIGVTGCVAQQEKQKILEEIPFVDFVLGPDNIDDLPEVLESLETENSRESRVLADFDTDPSRVWKTQTLLLNPGPTAFINVMKGCDHFCSYCVVPLTRGRERSRPIEDIVEDVRRLTSQGVREITFLGQNINTFGKRAGENLADLFHRVHEVEDLKRIRFTTSHPGDLEDSLIECFRVLPKLCSSFHLPFQSGSDKILRGMRRFYTKAQYLERVAALRDARPDLAFSTDIIVGFPGETDSDFLETLDVAKTVKFDNAYSFIYSPRPGTKAFELKNDLTEGQKVERLMTLQNELRSIARSLHAEEVGKNKEILIEGSSKKDPAFWTGRTSQNVPTHISKAEIDCKPGDLVTVRITDSTLTHLKATVL